MVSVLAGRHTVAAWVHSSRPCLLAVGDISVVVWAANSILARCLPGLLSRLGHSAADIGGRAIAGGPGTFFSGEW